jgi:hypothetical protein
VRKALIVTVTEGVELLPQAAFASSSLRSLGFDPVLLPTDFCTAQDGFQTAVRAADPAAVVFVDGAEWREILATLAGFACGTTSGPVVVMTSLPAATFPDDFPARAAFIPDGDGAALARVLGAKAGGAPPPGSLPLDYRLFGGEAILRRAMGCSLFAETGSIALLASRPPARETSPTAALARLEGPSSAGRVTIDPAAAQAPLAALGGAARAVEWWDRSFRPAHDPLLAEARRLGLRQTVRLFPKDATEGRLASLREAGVSRIAIECDALDGKPSLPGAAGTAADAASAIARARAGGLDAGVLLVVGLPGETAALARDRRARLEQARPSRVRVVPFEPAGGTEAWSWCVARKLWPPRENRWNREIHQPLEQPESGDYAAVLEEALTLLALVETAGAP